MKTINLTQGQVTKVSDRVYEELAQYKWFALWSNGTRTYYAARQAPTLNGKRRMIRMHTVIANAPSGYDTDHIDGDTLNNQDENLRVCTHMENMRNRGAQSNNKSGYKGVCFNKGTGKWVAQITINKKKTSLGYFLCPELAAKRYDEVASIEFGDYASLNFTDRKRN